MFDKPKAAKLYKNFFSAYHHQSFLACALILGILCMNLNSPYAKKALALVGNKISKKNLNSMIDAVIERPVEAKQLNNPQSTRQLNAFLAFVIKQPKWANMLDEAHLVSIGQNLSFSRWAIFRLIQKANPKCHFTNVDLLLDETGIEHSHECVAKAYKIAKRLPLEHLLNLAKTQDIAQIILLDSSAHPNRFILAQKLIDKHPMLAKNVARHWAKLCNTVPLSKVETKKMVRACEQLKAKHPSFGKVLRTKRVQRIVKHKASTKTSSHLDTYLSGAWTILNTPRILRLSHLLSMGLKSITLGTAGPTLSAMGYSTLAITTPWLGPILLYQGLKMFNCEDKEDTLPSHSPQRGHHRVKNDLKHQLSH